MPEDRPVGFSRWSAILPSALLGLAVFTVGFAVWSISSHTTDSIVIDLAGRQRLLSQRYINEVLLAAEGRTTDHASTRELFLTTSAVLRDGGTVVLDADSGESRELRATDDPEIRSKLTAGAELFREQARAAEKLLDLDPADPGYAGQVELLLKLGELTHSASNDAVRLLDVRAERAVGAALRWIAVGLACIVLMGLALLIGSLRVRRLLGHLDDQHRQRRQAVERFDLAVAGSTDGIWDWNVPTDEVYYSPRFKQLIGYADDEIVNEFESFRSRLHPDDLDATLEAVRAHLEARVAYDTEYRLLTKSGDYLWFRARGQALWDAAGKPARMSGSITDITDHKRAEHLLEREALRAKLLHRATTMAADTDDFHEALKHCVDAVCELSGWPVGHVYVPDPDGRARLIPIDVWYSEHPEDYRPLMDVTARTTFAPGIGLPGRIWKSGEPAWIVNVQSDSNFPRAKLCDDVGVKGAFGFPVKIRGELVAVLEFFTRQEMREDPELLTMVRTLGLQVGRVLERKRAESELRTAKRQAEASSVAKSQFLANMSHELRTPLNSIIGFSNILFKNKAGNLGPKDLSFLERVRENGKHLLSLINDILDISKIEADRLDLEIEPVRLDGLVEETLEMMEAQAKDKGLSLTAELPETIDPVAADGMRLKQVLINLVGNAIKFSDKGDVTVRVVPIEGTTRSTRLDVIDSGIGITPDNLDLVFNKFQQADASTTREYGGSGLGLAISRALCRRMGFDLTVASREGRGSTFSIVFEGPPPAPPIEMESEDPASADSDCVLVIDDDPDSRLLLKEYIEETGCRVVAVATGEEGLASARRQKPRLITLDLMMPGMDGWQVLHRLKSDPELREIPVVVVSIVAGENRGAVIGAVDALPKPLDKEQLHSILRSQLRRAIRRVLVVDDDADSRELLRREMLDAGLEVAEAVDGATALQRIESRRPDLVLLDLMMPGMDGTEVLTRLRSDPRYQDLPVIVVTAKDLVHQEVGYLEDHGARIVLKGDQLGDRLRSVLQGVLNST